MSIGHGNAAHGSSGPVWIPWFCLPCLAEQEINCLVALPTVSQLVLSRFLCAEASEPKWLSVDGKDRLARPGEPARDPNGPSIEQSWLQFIFYKYQGINDDAAPIRSSFLPFSSPPSLLCPALLSKSQQQGLWPNADNQLRMGATFIIIPWNLQQMENNWDHSIELPCAALP